MRMLVRTCGAFSIRVQECATTRCRIKLLGLLVFNEMHGACSLLDNYCLMRYVSVGYVSNLKVSYVKFICISLCMAVARLPGNVEGMSFSRV